MNAPDPTTEPATEAHTPFLTQGDRSELDNDALDRDGLDALDAGETRETATSDEGALEATGDVAPGDAELGPVAPPVRKKLEEQLEALKRKEFELRRALAIADHPELADAVRIIEGRAYQISRVEAKLSQGLSKSEERRKDTLEKKLGSLREKRADLDAQIGAFESELAALGAERATSFAEERRLALEQLLVALGSYEASLRAAGMEASSLVPEIGRWLPEIETLAESLVAARPSA